MTSEQFNAWLELMELGVKEAAEELHVSTRSVTSWRNGKNGPKWLPLLCAAVTYGLKPWRITPPASKIGLYDPLADIFIDEKKKRA
jgi:DNA-binding XRE family transcriptional regulator